MGREWDANRDPTLSARRSVNDQRYGWYFWALLVLGTIMTVAGLATAPPAALGGAMVLGAAFSVRHAGRVRRDETDLAYARAYGAEAVWFVLGLGLFIGGGYVFHVLER